MPIQAFVLHLERAIGRRPQVARLQAALPLSTVVLPAVDGLVLTQAEKNAAARSGLHRPHYPFALSRTEIACFLSHRRAWQAIVDLGLDAGLVVEDDADIVTPAFEEVLATVIDGLRADELVRFPHRERHESGPEVRSRGNIRLVEPRLPALGMVMQLVGREAARRLLDASSVFDRPVDAFVQLQWVHGARILTARPIVIQEIGGNLGGSVIHARRALLDRVVREVQRPLIRLAIHRANERWRHCAGPTRAPRAPATSRPRA